LLSPTGSKTARTGGASGKPIDVNLQREFALKLNKYLPPMEKVFQEYAIEASSKLGLNNFIRFLKEYQLITKVGEETGVLPKKTNNPVEYKKITTERAQIIFKQTLKQACARLNFE
jgi:hypothetical protein